MGSVVISDVGTDIARYPHSGMVGYEDNYDRHQKASNQRQNSQSSNFSYNQSRHTSATQVPTSASSARAIDSTSQASTNSKQAQSALPTPQTSQSGPQSATVHQAVQEEAQIGDQGYDRAGFPLTNAPQGLTSSPPSPQLLPTVRSSLSFSQSQRGSPTRIKVKDLNHIHSFASEEVLAGSQHGVRRFDLKKPEGAQYEISEMPVTDIIEMVAGLLTKITTTNDRQHQHEHINRHIPAPEGTSAVNQQTASVLSFHGKNVPSITILSYLSRIHKYCPTTYEVFLSLLVYFDRMTEMINNGTLSSFQSAAKSAERELLSPSSTTSFQAELLNTQTRTPGAAMATPPSSGSATASDRLGSSSATISTSEAGEDVDKLAHYFVVDSFNIHRLVIAGVTCASKFFSDVFYTNSRYAKVRQFDCWPGCLQLTLIGWRVADPRAQPSRAPVSSAQRFPPFCTGGGA